MLYITSMCIHMAVSHLFRNIILWRPVRSQLGGLCSAYVWNVISCDRTSWATNQMRNRHIHLWCIYIWASRFISVYRAVNRATLRGIPNRSVFMRGFPKGPLVIKLVMNISCGSYIYIYIYIGRERERERKIQHTRSSYYFMLTYDGESMRDIA